MRPTRNQSLLREKELTTVAYSCFAKYIQILAIFELHNIIPIDRNSSQASSKNLIFAVDSGEYYDKFSNPKWSSLNNYTREK